jgi:hypothetical protein
VASRFDRPFGVTALSAFFAVGALVAGTTGLALVRPVPWLGPVWRSNPDARPAFAQMGGWAVVLMTAVAAACAAAAAGLWLGRRWGHRIAVGLLGLNLVGDLLNALLRGDRRTLIGLPIGGAMLVYLISRRIRDRFGPPADRHIRRVPL